MRNVVVTGGSRGLGLAIAQKLAEADYRVIAIARQPSEALSAAMEQWKRDGRELLRFWPFDLADTHKIPGLVKALRKEFGAFYGLVNNAGLGTSGILATMHDEQIARLVHVNTVSPLLLTKYVVRSMMADGGGGRIVNIASVVAASGVSGVCVYAATKASLVGFTRSLAREVGPLGITVNAVAPGFVATKMTEDLTESQREQVARRSALHRLTEATDVADAVEFLISERARNITGTVLAVDAGSTA